MLFRHEKNVGNNPDFFSCISKTFKLLWVGRNWTQTNKIWFVPKIIEVRNSSLNAWYHNILKTILSLLPLFLWNKTGFDFLWPFIWGLRQCALYTVVCSKTRFRSDRKEGRASSSRSGRNYLCHAKQFCLLFACCNLSSAFFCLFSHALMMSEVKPDVKFCNNAYSRS